MDTMERGASKGGLRRLCLEPKTFPVVFDMHSTVPSELSPGPEDSLSGEAKRPEKPKESTKVFWVTFFQVVKLNWVWTKCGLEALIREEVLGGYLVR